MSQDFQSGPLE